MQLIIPLRICSTEVSYSFVLLATFHACPKAAALCALILASFYLEVQYQMFGAKLK